MSEPHQSCSARPASPAGRARSNATAPRRRAAAASASALRVLIRRRRGAAAAARSARRRRALQQLSGSALDSVKSGPDHTTRDIQDTATRRRRRLDRARPRVAPRRIGARQLDALRAGLSDGLPGKTQALGRLRRAHRERCLLRGAIRVLRVPRARSRRATLSRGASRDRRR